MLIPFGVFSAGVSAASSTYELISSTVVSGTSSLITFSSIPQTYKHLQVRAVGRSDGALQANMIYSRMNGDSTAKYSSHRLYGNGLSANSDAYTTGNNAWTGYMPGASAASGHFSPMVYDLLDYTSTTKNKTFKSLSGAYPTADYYVFMISGLYQSTSAITSLEFFHGTGNWVTGTRFSLYGTKG